MSERYYRAKKAYGEDPASLLRRMEARYTYLSLKEDITYLELIDKWFAWDMIRVLYRIVSAHEKKIN
jgi:hypothetical protein